jgi:hypothetical protein
MNKGFGIGMEGSLIDSLGCPYLAQPSLIQDGHAVGQSADNRKIVRNKNKCGSAFSLQIFQKFEHSGLDRNIECRCDFITQYHLGVGGKGPCNRYSLLFTAR